MMHLKMGRNVAAQVTLAAALALAMAWPAQALQTSPAGASTRYACGGVGQSEQLQMKALRPAYNLWISTVALGSGAFVADARLRISAEGDVAPRLDLRMDGPWCLVALPAGRYRIDVAIEGRQAPPQTVSVPADGLIETLFRLPVAAEVSPERAASATR